MMTIVSLNVEKKICYNVLETKSILLNMITIIITVIILILIFFRKEIFVKVKKNVIKKIKLKIMIFLLKVQISTLTVIIIILP